MKKLSTFLYMLLIMVSHETSAQDFNLEVALCRVGEVVEASKIDFLNQEEAGEIIESFSPFDTATSGVIRWQIVYRTTSIHGGCAQASGQVVIPDIPIDSLQNAFVVLHNRGTTTSTHDAASLRPYPTEQSLFLSGSRGYITLEPDYNGLGLSTDSVHVYPHKHTGIVVSDFLLASHSFLIEHGINTRKDIIVTGHSEGAFVTKALLEVYPNRYPLEVNSWEITLSIGISGPYIPEVMEHAFFNGYPNPEYSMYSLVSYKKAFPDSLPTWGEMFKPPYDERLPNIFNGENPLKDVRKMLLGLRTEDLMTPAFLDSLKNSTYRKLILQQEVAAQKYPFPLVIIGCQEDKAVPPENDSLFTQKLTQTGNSVRREIIPSGGHDECAPLAYFKALGYIDAVFHNLE